MPPKYRLTKFPPNRIKKVMQQDDDIGKVVCAVPPLVSRIAELFLADVLQRSAQFAEQGAIKTVNVVHLHRLVHADKRITFLERVVDDADARQRGQADNSMSKLRNSQQMSSTTGGGGSTSSLNNLSQSFDAESASPARHQPQLKRAYSALAPSSSFHLSSSLSSPARARRLCRGRKRGGFQSFGDDDQLHEARKAVKTELLSSSSSLSSSSEASLPDDEEADGKFNVTTKPTDAVDRKLHAVPGKSTVRGRGRGRPRGRGRRGAGRFYDDALETDSRKFIGLKKEKQHCVDNFADSHSRLHRSTSLNVPVALVAERVARGRPPSRGGGAKYLKTSSSVVSVDHASRSAASPTHSFRVPLLPSADISSTKADTLLPATLNSDMKDDEPVSRTCLLRDIDDTNGNVPSHSSEKPLKDGKITSASPSTLKNVGTTPNSELPSSSISNVSTADDCGARASEADNTVHRNDTVALEIAPAVSLSSLEHLRELVFGHGSNIADDSKNRPNSSGSKNCDLMQRSEEAPSIITYANTNQTHAFGQSEHGTVRSELTTTTALPFVPQQPNPAEISSATPVPGNATNFSSFPQSAAARTDDTSSLIASLLLAQHQQNRTFMSSPPAPDTSGLMSLLSSLLVNQMVSTANLAPSFPSPAANSTLDTVLLAQLLGLNMPSFSQQLQQPCNAPLLLNGTTSMPNTINYGSLPFTTAGFNLSNNNNNNPYAGHNNNAGLIDSHFMMLNATTQQLLLHASPVMLPSTGVSNHSNNINGRGSSDNSTDTLSARQHSDAWLTILQQQDASSTDRMTSGHLSSSRDDGKRQ